MSHPERGDHSNRIPGESRDPLCNGSGADPWVPAFAGNAQKSGWWCRSAGFAARLDRLGLDPVIGVEADQILDFLAQGGEFGVADARVAAGRHDLAERMLHRMECGAEQDLRVDAAAVAHCLEVAEREDRPPVAIAAALHPDERHACKPGRRLRLWAAAR